MSGDYQKRAINWTTVSGGLQSAGMSAFGGKADITLTCGNVR